MHAGGPRLLVASLVLLLSAPARAHVGSQGALSVTRVLVCVQLLAILRTPCENVHALDFRVPKHGRAYDTSEMVFIFERDASEDGYPVLEVDGSVVRSFDFKAMDYEISMMGQQVGQHSAVVRLMEVGAELRVLPTGRGTRSFLHLCSLHGVRTHARALQLPEGDDGATAGNRELSNASVIYSIADPGTGVNFMRSALGGGGDDDTSAADQAYERGQVSTICIQRRGMPSFT